MADFRSLSSRVRDFAKALSERGLDTYASSCAFYSFLSLFPMAALAVSLVPCFGIPRTTLLRLMDDIVPKEVAGLMKYILTNVYERVFPVLPLSMVMLLWSSARAISELLKGMAALVGQGLTSGYLKRRLRAILLTMALLLTILLSLTVLLFGTRIAALVRRMFPQAAGASALMILFSHLVMALLLWLLFIFLFRSIPDRQFTFREVRTSAALAAAFWILLSGAFSLLSDRLMDLTLYGGLSAMVLTMLWLFYCHYILLIGAGLCAWWQTKKEAAIS